MKILIISGTPKTDGVTYSFVKTSEETIAELGMEVETVRLAGLNLTKCKMCKDGWGICFKDHYCSFGDEDGFNKLQEKVKEADAYIYITPVYWGELSEDLKIFVDKLRRCQASKQWDSREEEVSFLIGKPSILVAVAGGGGGGIISAFEDLERAIVQWGGNNWPHEKSGIFDHIAVNRWNQEYKRETLKAAIKEMVKYHDSEPAEYIPPLISRE
ncbi:MAG: flavodoxin family protein [Defluviitaleaceae bacterium]|nr:flavodoxin family protein [Defluviitaleaceae bacterium]